MSPLKTPGNRRSASRRLSNQSTLSRPTRSATKGHRRTTSNGTEASVRSAPGSTRRNRRLNVRQSLLGPQVEELTVQRRAEMLIDVAGDCLLKLLGAGLDGRRTSQLEWRKAWDSFRAIRETYIFPADGPPFPLYGDILQDFESRSRTLVDPTSLQQAVDLGNLVTFVYTIMRPDEAGELFPDSLPSRKGKEKAREGRNPLDRVERRNAILIEAWEMFWVAVVPKDQRDKEVPLRLWLEFATQIYITFRCPTIDPPSSSNALFPAPSTEITRNVFGLNAISKYGQWEQNEGFESGSEVGQSEGSEIAGMDQEIVQSHWETAVKKRERELKSTRLETLQRRHPFDAFRRDLLSYIEEEVLGIPPEQRSGYFGEDDSQLASESEQSDVYDTVDRRASLRSATRTNGPLKRARTLSPVKAERAPLTRRRSRGTSWAIEQASEDEYAGQSELSLTDVIEEEGDLDDAEASLGEESEGDMLGDSEAIEWDMFAEVAAELEAEQAQADTPKGATGPRTSAHRDDIDLESNDGSTPRAKAHASELKSFNFAAKQKAATQLGWDSPSSSQVTPRNTIVATGPQKTPQARSSLRPSIGTRSIRAQAAARRSRLGSEVRFSLGPEDDIPEGLRDASVPLIRDHLHLIGGDHDVIHEDDGEDAAVELDELLPDTQQLLGDINKPEESDGADLFPDDEQLLGDTTAQNLEVEVDLFPDSQQLLGDAPEEESQAPAQSQTQAGHLMPNDSQLGLGEPGDVGEVTTKETAAPIVVDLISSEDSIVVIDQAQAAAPEQLAPRVPPTSQQLLTSSRVKNTADALEFAAPDANEDAEDRQLFLRVGSSVPPAVDENREDRAASPIVKMSPAPSPPPASFIPQRFADPYLLDSDGSPLRTDASYAIPPDHEIPRSRIHGRVGNQLSSYSRISGRRKWTTQEELLLYRTVQKVSYTEAYPLRVVWYLHGEFGALSNQLEMYNPQHMKDKMRVIVTRRSNQGLPVLMRARAFLPPGHPGRVAYEQEWEDVQNEFKKQSRDAAEAEAAEGVIGGDQVHSQARSKDDEEGRKTRKKGDKAAPKKGKKGTKGKKATKGKSRGRKSGENEEDDDEDEDEGEEEGDKEAAPKRPAPKGDIHGNHYNEQGDYVDAEGNPVEDFESEEESGAVSPVPVGRSGKRKAPVKTKQTAKKGRGKKSKAQPEAEAEAEAESEYEDAQEEEPQPTKKRKQAYVEIPAQKPRRSTRIQPAQDEEGDAVDQGANQQENADEDPDDALAEDILVQEGQLENEMADEPAGEVPETEKEEALGGKGEEAHGDKISTPPPADQTVQPTPRTTRQNRALALRAAEDHTESQNAARVVRRRVIEQKVRGDAAAGSS